MCMRQCFGVSLATSNASQSETSINEVVLDSSTMGSWSISDFKQNKLNSFLVHTGRDVVIIKNGCRICGRGGAITNYPIVQDKAYWEGKVQQTGVWGIGLATNMADLNSVPLGTDNQSWVLRNDGKIVHNNVTLHDIGPVIQDGDIVGVCFDHVQLQFRVNDEPIEFGVTNIKSSQIYPVVYVDTGAIVDMIFNNFTFRSPSNYDRILIEQVLL